MEKINASVLIIDDDADVLTAARVVLRQVFKTVEGEINPQKINFLLNNNLYDVILLDMNFSVGKSSGNEGLTWLKQIHAMNPQQKVIAITAYGDIQIAVEAMKLGATDFIVKPWDNEKLEATVMSAVRHAKTQNELATLQEKTTALNLASSKTANEIIGSSQAMRKVLNDVLKVASTDASVLLLGENGTGKELIAKFIHANSKRKDNAFISVDAGAIPENLFESELFGHKKGSFTDAREDRLGRIELAHKGTLFLDEIGNIPLNLQSKLLSVLQSREVTPIGAKKSIPVDIRLISATNISIHEAVYHNVFRQDLLYRINTVEIVLPPLRDRQEDIPLLVNYFLKKYTTRYRKEKTIDTSTLSHLQAYDWPGNVRELQHALERAVIMSDSRNLKKEDFIIRRPHKQSDERNDSQHALSLDDLEKKAIIESIKKHKGNLTKVAAELGLGRTTLYRKMIKYEIDR